VSNVFKDTKVPFFPVPQALVTSGKLKELSGGGLRLYQLVLFLAQKHTRVALRVSNQEIEQQAGLSPNTARRARTKLWEARLVDLRRTQDGQYIYILLNPLTGTPLQGRGSDLGSDNSPPSSGGSAPPWHELGR